MTFNNLSKNKKRTSTINSATGFETPNSENVAIDYLENPDFRDNTDSVKADSFENEAGFENFPPYSVTYAPDSQDGALDSGKKNNGENLSPKARVEGSNPNNAETSVQLTWPNLSEMSIWNRFLKWLNEKPLNQSSNKEKELVNKGSLDKIPLNNISLDYYVDSRDLRITLIQIFYLKMKYIVRQKDQRIFSELEKHFHQDLLFCAIFTYWFEYRFQTSQRQSYHLSGKRNNVESLKNFHEDLKTSLLTLGYNKVISANRMYKAILILLQNHPQKQGESVEQIRRNEGQKLINTRLEKIDPLGFFLPYLKNEGN
jgi:hypothetical protein